MSIPFNAWSFTRDAISYGCAIEQDTVRSGRGFEEHSVIIDKRASILAEVLEAELTSIRSRVEALEGVVRELVQACGCEEENKRIVEVMHIPKNGGPPTFSDPEEHCPVCTKALAFLARIRGMYDV